MKVFLDADKVTGIISGWSSTPESNLTEVEVDRTHPVLTNFGRYLFKNGRLEEDKNFNSRNKSEQFLTVEQRLNNMQKALDDLIIGGGF